MSLELLPPCCMSLLSPMLHVEFKKRLCHPVGFRGQGPYPMLHEGDNLPYHGEDSDVNSKTQNPPEKEFALGARRK